jgi:hypothetical protein
MKQTSFPSCVAALACVAIPALAGPFNFSFQTVVNPGDPAFTQLLGINNASTIAGYFGDGMVVPNNGFTLTLPNSFTPENFPASSQTQVVGINNLGETVGFYVDAGGVTHGFTFNGGTFSTVDQPGTSFNQLLGVNDLGTAAGYSSNDPTGMTNQQAFTETGLTFTALTPFFPAGTGNSQATDVNLAGEVSGFYVDSSSVTHGFLLDGSLMTLNFPGATLTQVLGVNNTGFAVGDYTDSANATHGFVYNVAAKTFQTVDDPSGIGTTVINGINDSDRVVGFYTDANGNVDGFVGTPVPEPASIILVGTLFVGTFLKLRRRRA